MMTGAPLTATGYTWPICQRQESQMEVLILIAVFLLIVLLLVAAILLEKKIQARYGSLPADARKSIDEATALQKKRERYFLVPVIALFLLGYVLARSPYLKGAGFVIILAVCAAALAGNTAFIIVQNRNMARLGNDAEMTRLQKIRSLLAATVVVVVAGIVLSFAHLIFR